ncbi:MAG: alpha/beta hydrolase-fold protein [Nocardioides sp.]
MPLARAGSQVTPDAVVFRLTDPDHQLIGVSLWSDLELPDAGVPFGRVADGWELRIPLPRLDRIEYMYSVRGTGGGGSLILDPGNPLRVGGAFGEHSWLPMPGYHPPDWLIGPAFAHDRLLHEIDTQVGTIGVEVWSPADSGDGASGSEALPLLLSHDGPEMDIFGQLTHCVGALIASGRLPRMRVALLSPGPRNDRYAANPAYSAALVEEVLPAVLAHHPTNHAPVLMGQSLGALAALHAQWQHPGTFGGLFLQSGSFFTQHLDPQESGFAGFGAITEFVGAVHQGAGGDHPAAAGRLGGAAYALVCGSAEENLGNNRLLAARLRAAGLDVAWGEVRDGHYWTTWRDLLDPHLPELLRRVWG